MSSVRNNLTTNKERKNQDKWLKSEKAKEEYDDLKKIILQYLDDVNITIDNYTKQKSIDYIEQDTIFNLDIVDNENYLNFLKFMAKELESINNEYEKNNGNIVTFHVFDKLSTDDKKEAETILGKLKLQYEENYVKDLKPSTNKFATKSKQLYPYFQKDMMTKSRRLQFEKVEEEMGITKPIQEQTPIEFLDTIVKRIDKLYSCYKLSIIPERYKEIQNIIEEKKKNDKKKYYRTELIREINQLFNLLNKLSVDKNISNNPELIDENQTDEIEKNSGVNNWENINITIQSTKQPTIQSRIKEIKNKINQIKINNNENDAKEIIKEHCKSILWGVNDSKYNKDIENEDKKEVQFQEFKKFIENNPIELLFLKTFMIDCFKKNETTNEYEINWDLVKAKMGDRTYRQMFFGFGEDIKIYENYKSVYEVVASNIIVNKNKNPNDCFLVIWSLFLNYYFNMCSITNTDIDFPIRFKLPSNYRKTDLNKTNKYKYEMRTPSMPEHNKDVFERENMKFIGFINIKYYHENSNNSLDGKFRNWKLFLFKTNDKKLKYINYMDVSITETPILSHKLQLVYEGSLFARDPVTYEELKFFKNKSDNGELFIYTTILDEQTLFISSKKDLEKMKHLKDLELNPVKLKLSDKNEVKHIVERYLSIIPTTNTIIKGGTLNFNLLLQFTNKLNMYNYDDLNDNNAYSNYLKNVMKFFFIKDDNEAMKYHKTIYKYILISPNDLLYLYKTNTKQVKILPKYNPLSAKFFHYNEIITKYNIISKYKNNKILNIGGITPIEVFNFLNYKNIDIKYINFYNLSDQQITYLNKIKKIYNVDMTDNYDKKDIYLLPYLYPKLYNSFNIIVYSIYNIDKILNYFDEFYNIINIYIGALVALKYTELNGIFILNLGNVCRKPYADIYLILKQYFNEAHLYYPEISNMVKPTGVFGIFKGFKGISKTELEKYETIFEELKEQYPNNMIDKFNIYEPELRKEFNINTPIETIKKRYKYIDGFLNINRKSKEFETMYKEIIEFNNYIYSKKLRYVNKLLYIYENNIIENTPTPDQIMSSIMYCRKYNIPFNDKYNEDKLSDLTNKTILDDMYGLSNPILGKFKTPFQTYIVNKIILNPKLKYKSKSKSRKKANSLPIFKTKSIILNSKLKPTFKSKSIKLKTKNNSNSFFNNLFKLSIKKSKKSKKSTSIKSTSQKSTSQKSITQKKSLFKHNNYISLDKALFNSNNSIKQAYLTIDSRKDFTKANPNEDYDNFKEEFRYYRSKGKDKSHNLNLTVQRILDDKSISQAWLKMYEIISECNIVPLNKNGVFKSFHFCEAPGTFINCLNNYIYTKTNFTQFEWLAQSLHPRLAKIKDAYGIIKRHPNNWDWGIDKTGDITNPENIKYYAKLIKLFNMENKNKIDTKQYSNIPFLITADAGLEPEDPKYKLVAYSSYVAILYSLPIHGMMVYKIKDIPLELPLIWNLIYITYTNFKEMYFFKPVQNSQSSEFYIIAKDYLGTIHTDIFDYLIKQIDKFDKKTYEPPTIDLFDNMYPEEFIVQLSSIYDKIARNHIHSIERIIYYVDNKDLIGNDYKKHIKDYILEKNEEWLKKYKVKRLAKNKIL